MANRMTEELKQIVNLLLDLLVLGEDYDFIPFLEMEL
jgi:hypothetical protein